MVKQKYLALPVVVMFLVGSVYAWSMFVPSLKHEYGLTASQTQLVFGAIIGTFTLSMLFSNRLQRVFSARGMYIASALFFCAGYLIASFSEGNFSIIFLGIGVFSGIGTGLSYMTSISLPVKWFPQKKGFITGLAASGFAAGSIVLTIWAGWLLNKGTGVLVIFRIIALFYGAFIFAIAFLLPRSSDKFSPQNKPLKIQKALLLFLAMFMGTFAGLLVIGNIKLMGAGGYTNNQLSLAIILFSIANLSGRLFWGWISDYKPVFGLLFIALMAQGVATLAIGLYELPFLLFSLFIFLIGVGFGSNFVLFAYETAQLFGVANLGRIYPVIFLGYGLAGIAGPVTGGALFDATGNFRLASIISLLVSVFGVVLFGLHVLKTRKGINYSSVKI
ncbi:MAG: MFS transporter [Prolixibacteraceae bacterium]|jgi:OFA family oxalate/formate antiporter-like MFS transporter|nr:MFS transporter [Prolixibacteraceae bacterium]